MSAGVFRRWPAVLGALAICAACGQSPLSASAASGASDAPVTARDIRRLEIERLAGEIVRIPDVGGLRVSVDGAHSAQVRIEPLEGGGLRVRGDGADPAPSCAPGAGAHGVRVVIRGADALSVRVRASALSGAFGDLAGLDLEQSGCRDLKVGVVDGRARVVHRGDGMVDLAGVRDLDLRTTAAGAVAVREVRGAFAASVEGPGRVRVRDGRASHVAIEIAGPGEVAYGGVADTSHVRIQGSGRVWIAQSRQRPVADIDPRARFSTGSSWGE